MIRTIYSIKDYNIIVLNQERNCLRYGTDVICKYDNTQEGICEMVGDLLEFCVDEGILFQCEVKTYRPIIKAIIARFNENERKHYDLNQFITPIKL